MLKRFSVDNFKGFSNKIVFDLGDTNNYDLYLNLTSRKSIAEFEYVFSFDEGNLIYRYGKSAVNILAYEKVLINDSEVIYYAD